MVYSAYVGQSNPAERLAQLLLIFVPPFLCLHRLRRVHIIGWDYAKYTVTLDQLHYVLSLVSLVPQYIPSVFWSRCPACKNHQLWFVIDRTMGERQNQEEPYKRFACDRCHIQKLRCTRNSSSHRNGEACIRCERARVACVYSPPEQLGRPPVTSRQKNRPNAGDSSRKRQRCETEIEMDWTETSKPCHDRTISDENLWSKVTSKETREKRANFDEEDVIDVHQICQQDPPSISETTFFSGDASPHNLNPTDTILSNSGRLSHDDASEDFVLSTGATLFDDLNFPSSPPASLSADDYAQFKNSSSSESSTLHENPKVHTRNSGPLPCFLSAHQAGSNDIDRKYGDNTPSNAKEECMVLLSKIIIRLSKQLKVISSDSLVKALSSSSQQPKLTGSFAAYDVSNDRINPVGEIFCISEELIQILRSIKPVSTGRPFTTVPDPYAGVQPHSSLKAQLIDHSPNSPFSSPSILMISDSLGPSTNPTRSAHSFNEDTRNIPSSSTNSYLLTPPHSSLQKEPSSNSLKGADSSNLLRLDIPIMVLVITCYNRLIKVYSVLFARCVRILEDYLSAPDGLMLPEILPFLELGGFKPSNNGTLQISIIVETSLHMVSQIENYLERPDLNELGGLGTQMPVLQVMDLVMKEDRSEKLRENTENIRKLIRKTARM